MDGAPPVHGADGQASQSLRDSKVFVNTVFESVAELQGDVAAELQAARLRLETTEGEKAAMAAELASAESRLHDALEVLEGVLSERSTLRRQTRELQTQLGAALDDQRSQHSPANLDRTSAGTAPASQSPRAATPRNQLRRELLLAQSQLGELRSVQQAWEAERAQLLQEVEEERQSLQEGLAQALTQATSAQREADAAAERASHWCSLAQVLQRSALLTEGGMSPSPLSSTSTASCYSPAADSAAKARSAASSAARSSASSSIMRLLTELRSPSYSPACSSHRTRTRLLASPPDSKGSAAPPAAGAGLISAFHAVAAPPASAEKVLHGSPVLPQPAAAQANVDAQQQQPSKALASNAGSARAPRCAVSASAELAPGTSLRLLHQLPTPGLSCASSLSLAGFAGVAAAPKLMTPEPRAAEAAADQGTPAGTCSENGAGSSPYTACQPAAQQAVAKTKKAPRQPGLLGKLLMRGVCAGGLPPAPVPAAGAPIQRWEQA